MKQYYVYMTTNLLNGKKYIGMHYGELDDNYLGSGSLLQRAINKYGSKNFKKEILQIAQSEEENAKNERELIKKYNAVADEMFYNIHEGGFGGDTWTGLPEEQKDERREQLSKMFSGSNNPRYGVHLSEETKQKIRDNRDTTYMYSDEYRAKMSLAVSGEKNGMYGRNHTEESKQKMSESKKGTKTGMNNSNAKKIAAYKDAAHTQLIQVFDCIQDALKFVNTRPNDYSGISKRMKENKPYKGFYWVKGVETNIEGQR